MNADKTESTPKVTAAKKISDTAKSVNKPANTPATSTVPKTTTKKKSNPKADKKLKASTKALALKEKALAKTANKQAKKVPKIKVVRDSFTMPKNEHMEISKIKDASKKAGLAVKKSEVLRAGLKALSALDMEQTKAILAGLDKVRTGRPKKG